MIFTGAAQRAHCSWKLSITHPQSHPYQNQNCERKWPQENPLSWSEENILEIISPKPEHGVADPAAALRMIREDLGDCTRCKLHKQGRKQIVFGVGNPRAELMFIGEGPGADEDAQGRALCRSCRAVA